MFRMKKYTFILMLLCLSITVVACNLAQEVPVSPLPPATFTSSAPLATPRQLPPSLTPLFGAPGSTPVPTIARTDPFSAQSASTPIPGVTIAVTIAQTPGTVTVAVPTGQIGDFISHTFNNIIVPIVNVIIDFFTNTVGYLWQLAGSQGGFLAQFICCILPGIVAVIYIWRRRPFRGRR
jgi:hypothetical protein